MGSESPSSSMKPIVIVGAGGAGREALFVLRACGRKVVQFLDTPRTEGERVGNVPVSPSMISDAEYVIGQGDPRERYRTWSTFGNVKYSTIQHPTAVVGSFVKIGEGTIISAGAVVEEDVKIGMHTWIGANVFIGHETMIGDWCVVNPSIIAGQVNIGSGVFVGIGASIKDEVKIGDWSIIGMGSVVTKSVSEQTVVYGNPARAKRTKLSHGATSLKPTNEIASTS